MITKYKKKEECVVCDSGWKSYGGDYDSLCSEHYLQIEPTGDSDEEDGEYDEND